MSILRYISGFRVINNTNATMAVAGEVVRPSTTRAVSSAIARYTVSRTLPIFRRILETNRNEKTDNAEPIVYKAPMTAGVANCSM